MIQRFAALLLAVLVGLPWAVMPVSAGTACRTAGAGSAAKSDAACSYCVPDSRAAAATAALSAGCCRYAPGAEAAPAQAGGVSLTPKSHLSPDAPVAALAGAIEVAPPDAFRIARSAERSLLAHAPPTETTHLLL